MTYYGNDRNPFQQGVCDVPGAGAGLRAGDSAVDAMSPATIRL